MNTPLNLYGDKAVFQTHGKGSDIASQRADDLDNRCLVHISATEKPYAIDLACGLGGQALRMAQAGAEVCACDLLDFSAEIETATKATGLGGKIKFMQVDMRHLKATHFARPADAIICQRAIHYLTFEDALGVVTRLRQLLAPTGRLYLSASGIRSELGSDYTGVGVPVEDRYAELSPEMAEKHDIRGPVCLYSQEDIGVLLRRSGFAPLEIYASAFGNIKSVSKIDV